MRMMKDMITMTTKAKTAANTATWEKRAAIGKRTQNIRHNINNMNLHMLEINL